ncbi:MAG: SEC61-beta family protein [Candidatus Kariarchaeaceae archaeon]|jgi:preprotein translocase subunit Sec61beta
MSRRKKRTNEAPMPSGSAGILSFYQEKTDSILKIRPELVIVMTLTLIIVVLLSSIFLS